MGKIESDHNAPGDFAVNPQECVDNRVCVYMTRLGLLGLKEYRGVKKPYIRRQPQNEDEKQILMNLVLSCPVDAINYKGSADHPEVKKYAAKINKDPSLLEPQPKRDR